MVTEIDFKEIVDLLKAVPKEKKYTTSSISIARGLNLYKGSFFKRLKKLING
jgi:hypothetical protein